MVRTLNYSFWKNKKVLITGHTGFKGSWLLSWLVKSGAEIKGIGLKPEDNINLFDQIESSLNDKFINVFGNILDKKFIEREIKEFQPEILIHLAAQPLVRESYANPLLTWETNVIGSLNILESAKKLLKKCAIVMITTDKVYKNREWIHGYRENDELGGHDPYSASKAACELAISSWRESFVGKSNHQTQYLKIATARAGNVIGGGDWAKDRILPDSIKSLISKKVIKVRNPLAKRPWQHVLEPLIGYLFLAEDLYLKGDDYCSQFNFGPYLSSNKTVEELVEEIIKIWPGKWENPNQDNLLHEANLLHLQIEKAEQMINWQPKWDFKKTIKYTVNWYKDFNSGENPYEILLKNIIDYESK